MLFTSNFRKFFLTFIVISSVSFGFAQISTDPSHKFYEYAQNWYLEGTVKTLPPLRPYSKNQINSILTQVIENGSVKNQELAKEFYEELNGKKWYLVLEADAKEKIDSVNGASSLFVPVFPSASGDLGFFNNFATLGYDIGISAYNQSEANYRPAYTNSLQDSILDPSTVGPYNLYLDMNDIVSIGTENIFVQAGINRTGYGSFLNDGIALNDTSYHAANLSFSIIREKFSYAQLYSVIGSSTNYNGEPSKPNKYLTLHQISYKILPELELSYYESIIYGERFDPSYFIPAPYMVIQGIGGCNDNLQMGIRADYNPFKGFLWATDIFVDDLAVNELVKFNFDTKIRVAAKTGIIYAFDSPVLNRISLDYTLVTPYTYAHSDYSQTSYWSSDSIYNYQNYTNNGISIGSVLPPNSDCINFKFSLNPFKNFYLDFAGLFARHANSAESFSNSTAIGYLTSESGKYATDGSIFMHQTLENTFLEELNEHLNFLTQEHKMYVLQLGLNAKYSLQKYKWGSLSFKAAYNFEYIHNKGVDSNLYPGGEVTDSGTTDSQGNTLYIIEGDSAYYTESQILEIYKNKWISSFYDIFANYFSFGIEYKF